jgi:hypothetical protein
MGARRRRRTGLARDGCLRTETSGYIIPTLLDLAEHLNQPDRASTAERMGEWLSEVQDPSGGFIEHDLRQDAKRSSSTLAKSFRDSTR